MTTILKVNNSSKFSVTVTNPDVVPIYVSDATVTVKVDALSGDSVLASTALDYTANGIYKKTVTTPLSITAGVRYVVTYDILGADGLVGQRVCTEIAEPPTC